MEHPSLVAGPLRAQLGGPHDEPGRLRTRPAPPGEVRRPVERLRDRLVGHQGRLGAVPGDALGVLGVRLGQEGVGRPAVRRRRPRVRRRAHQRVPEPHGVLRHPHQAVALGGREVGEEAGRLDGAAQHPQVTVGRRREQQDPARVRWQLRELLAERDLDTRGRGPSALARRGRTPQLQERERVAGGPFDDGGQAQGVQADAGLPQQHRRLVLGQRGELDARVVAQWRRSGVAAGGGEERDVRAGEPVRDEPEHRQGRVVAPLHVVDDQQDRRVLGEMLEPLEHGEPEPERIGRGAGGGREDQVEHRRGIGGGGEEVDQAPERQVAVAGMTGQGQDEAPFRGPCPGDDRQDRGLAGPGDPGDHGRAPAGVEQLAQAREGLVPPDETIQLPGPQAAPVLAHRGSLGGATAPRGSVLMR